MNKVKICFLVSEYVPHQVTTIKTLLQTKDNIEILAFSFDKNRDRVPLYSRFCDYDSEKLHSKEIIEIIENFNPCIIVSAGWMYKTYVSVCKYFRTQAEVKTIAYSDTPWYGRLTQKINALISPFYLKKVFDYIWVAGARQYDYARKLGFDNNHILFHCLSADVELFTSIPLKRNSSFKNMVFIGRFAKVKGLNYLLNAWNSIIDKKGWTLTLIGEGELKENIKLKVKDSSVIIKDYMDQKELLEELSKSDCFILPSVYEPWALVIHEAAAAGLPIICTDVCGASPHFVIDGYNGYKVAPYSVEELYIAINKILNANNRDLIRMSYNSRKLSTSITPELTAASLIQKTI